MIKKFLKNRLINKYIQSGKYIGDSISYMPLLGEPVGFRRSLEKFIRLEKKYSNLGYRTISLDDFVFAGGYDKDIDHLICVRLDKDEKNIFHGPSYMSDLELADAIEDHLSKIRDEDGI